MWTLRAALSLTFVSFALTILCGVAAQQGGSVGGPEKQLLIADAAIARESTPAPVRAYSALQRFIRLESGPSSSPLLGLLMPQGGTQNVIWTNAVNVTASGNNLTNTGGSGSAWDAGASSTQVLASGDGYVEFSSGDTSTSKACGLSHADVNQNYTSIDYAFYTDSYGSLYVFESGTYEAYIGSFSTTDVLHVGVEGGVVVYRQNGGVVYTSSKPPTSSLLVDTSFNSAGLTWGNSGRSGGTITNAVVTFSSPVNHPPVSVPGGPYSGTAGTSVTFNGSGSSDADAGDSVASYAWNFGDSGTASGVSPTHTYASAGTYTVTLTVTDTHGATGSATATATIVAPNHPPVAVPGGPYSGTSGTAVTFNGSGSHDPDTGDSVASYAWNFGDSGTGTGVSPTHTYASAGTYTVTLTVTDTHGATGSATATATIVAPNHPPVAVPGGPYSGTSGTAVTFNGSGSSDPDAGDSVASYAWNFGDSGTGTGVSPTHTFASAGTYTVTLTVTDTHGATGSATATATIAARPPVAVPGGPYSGTTGTAVTFNGSGSSDPNAGGSVASYAWNFGDSGTGTGVSPTHTYTSAGTYTVTLTVTDNYGAQGSASTTAAISTPVNHPPVAVITGGPYTITAGAALQFDGSQSYDPDTGDSIASYSWDFGDGGTAAGTAAPRYTYATVGPFTVTLSVTDTHGAHGSVTTMVTIQGVQPPPQQAPTPTADGQTTINFTFAPSGAFVPPGTIVTNQWQSQDVVFAPYGSAGYGFNLNVHTVMSFSGRNYIESDWTDAFGNRSVTGDLLIAFPIPVNNLSFSLLDVADTYPYPQRWTADVTVITNGVSITMHEYAYGSAGTIPVNLSSYPNVSSVYVSGLDNIDPFYLSNQPLYYDNFTFTYTAPSAVFTGAPYSGTVGKPVQFDGSASHDPGVADSIATYAWDFGDGVKGTGAKPTHTYASAGTYTVKLTVTDNQGVTGSNQTQATITSASPPTAVPGGPYFGAVGAPMNFDGSASHDSTPGGSLTYDWDFGDQTQPSSAAKPSHIYNSAGVYNVTLTVTNTSGATNTVTTQATAISAVISNSYVTDLHSPTTPNNANLGAEINFIVKVSPSVFLVRGQYSWTLTGPYQLVDPQASLNLPNIEFRSIDRGTTDLGQITASVTYTVNNVTISDSVTINVALPTVVDLHGLQQQDQLAPPQSLSPNNPCNPSSSWSFQPGCQTAILFSATVTADDFLVSEPSQSTIKLSQVYARNWNLAWGQNFTCTNNPSPSAYTKSGSLPLIDANNQPLGSSLQLTSGARLVFGAIIKDSQPELMPRLPDVDLPDIYDALQIADLYETYIVYDGGDGSANTIEKTFQVVRWQWGGLVVFDSFGGDGAFNIRATPPDIGAPASDYHNQGVSVDKMLETSLVTAPGLTDCRPRDFASIDQTPTFVGMLYLQFYNEQPSADPQGINYWRGQISGCAFNFGCNKTRRTDVAWGFFTASQTILAHQELAGFPGAPGVNPNYDHNFVLDCYVFFLKRTPSTDPNSQDYDPGLQEWIDALESANSPGYRGLVDAFLNCPEFYLQRPG
jgi:PKD repeat protein